MDRFYIKKLTVTGQGKEPSIITFGKGLNIVCGPSDTGKSYIIECIDYIFGGSTIPIDPKEGYDCVKMIVETSQGTVTAERFFNTNKLSVSSTDPRVETGEYGTRSGKLNANTDLWLKLIGIEERHSVIWKKTFEKKALTWRYFLHMFLIKEDRIIQRSSILLPNQNTATTGALASLLYLITGEDFADADPREEKKIRVARKAAVADYIRGRLAYFADRKGALDDFDVPDSIDLQSQVEDIIDEISQTENRIADTSRRNKNILRQIFALNEQLTECDTLYGRYIALQSQYKSDVRRLAFIVEGEYRQANYPVSAKCPFCDHDIEIDSEASYIEASHAELHRIQLQIQDLCVSETELVTERHEIESRIASLNAEKETVEELLNNELKPRAVILKKTLAEYRKAMEVHDEFSFISSLEISMKSELFDAEMEDEESEIEFSIKSRFDRSILDVFDRHIENVLRSCKYEGFGSARLGLSSFDVLVNEKDKGTFGKGYRAFLNTAFALALAAFLTESAKYSPGLLVVDSPILSLTEPCEELTSDEQASDSMKTALFQYMTENQSNVQTIIIENNIPEIDYGNGTTIIRFTKDETIGRYGFLMDAR
ncbi:AAA family ATPase [Marasmitruncus massiliensis]|uniref:AAA family ATPase n=1 Tax=Marasmitruncus massiliensis TaxID=1944642 RepID=UPI000C79ADDE|nr:AAA family ATPase [Marasmitruncus massiliensis]